MKIIDNKKILNLKEIDTFFFNRGKTLKNIFPQKEKKLKIFDVGANVGQSLKEFKKWYPFSEIHCFEPDTESMKILQKNNYENIIYNLVGVGAIEEIKTFYRYSLNTINSFLEIDTHSKVFQEQVHRKVNQALEKEVRKEEVKLISLDIYCKQKNIENINIVKIDVQGFEVEVLKGAEELIKENRIDVFIIEITFDEIYGKGTSFYDIEKRLIPFGYKLWDISHIYKDLNKNRTNWVDAIYIKKNLYEVL